MNLLDSLRRLHPDLSDLDDSRFVASVYDQDPRLAQSGITPGEYFGMLGLQEAGSARQARQPLGIDRGGPAPEDVSAVGEFGAGFGRGVLGVLKTPFSLAEFAGDVTGSESLERLGRWGTEPIEQYIEESPRLQKAPSISGDIRKNPQLWTDPAWYLSLVGEGLPTIFSMLLPGAALGKGAQALGLGVKGVGAARAIGVAGASMGLEAGAAAETAKGYEERTGEQIPAGRKVAAVLGTGVLAGSLESIPILNFFGKSVGRTLIRKVLSSMALEGGTEGAQELVANAFAKYGYDPTQDMVEGVIESVVAGAIIGAPFGAAKTMQERLEEAAGPKNFNEVVKNIEASEKEIVAHEPAGRIIEPGKEIKVGVPAPTNMIGGEPVAEAAQGVAKEPLYVDEKYGKVLAHEKGMVKVGIQTDMMTGKASTQGDIAQTMAPKKKVVTPGIDLGEAEREIARNKFLDRPREYPSVGPELPVTEVGEQAGHVLAKDVKMAPEPFMAPQFEPVDTFLEGVGEPGTTAGEILGKESPVPATGETPSLSQEEPGPGIPPAQAPAPGEGVGVSPPAPAPPSGAPKEELPKFSRTPKGALSYSQKKPKGGAPEAQRVFDYLKPTLASWRNAPSVKVVQSEKELPVAIYAEAKKRETEGATPGIKGAFYAGQVHIVADNITNMRDAERTLAHEALRHYGFRLFLGEKYKAEMQRASKNKTVADLAKAKAAQYKLNISKSADAYAAIEEALAEMGDKGVKSSAWDRIVNLFKKWLRKVFPHQAEGMTDREVRQLISDSSWAVRKGKRQTQTYITKGTAFMPLGEDVGKEPAFMRKALDSFPDISIVRETGPVHDKGIWNWGKKHLLDEGDHVLKKVFTSKDLGFFSKLFSLPHWLGKRFPEFKEVLNIGEERVEDRMERLAKFGDSMAGMFALKRNPKAMTLAQSPRDYFNKIVFDLEGVKVTDEERFSRVTPAKDYSAIREDGGKFQIVREDGKVLKEYKKEKSAQVYLDSHPDATKAYELNEAHYKALEEHILKEYKDVPAEVVQAYMDLRRGFDRALADVTQTMGKLGVGKDIIKKYRQSIDRIHNYFPHMRYGRWFVKADANNKIVKTDDGFSVVTADGRVLKSYKKRGPAEKYLKAHPRDTVFRQHFDSPGSNRKFARMKASRLIAPLKKDYARMAGLEWSMDLNKKLPEESVYNVPIPVHALQQIVDRGVDSLPGSDEKGKAALRTALSKEVANLMKSRGWGQRMMQRKDVQGYEKDDLERVVFDYFSGLAGWLSKMDASYKFAQALKNINAKEAPELYDYSVGYVRDTMRNIDDVDRMVDKMKWFAFVWYLGWNLKTAAVNLTQNIIAGVPRLQMDFGAGAFRYYRNAGKDLIKVLRQGKGLNEEESKAFKVFYDKGVGQANLMRELRGRLRDVKPQNAKDRIIRFADRTAGIPMELAERFNRGSLFLAAYRLAKEGRVKNEKTLTEFGYKAGEGFSKEDATRLAIRIVKDAHFVYGRSNRPLAVRGSALTRAISPVYTFRTFTHNLLSLWAMMLREAKGGNRDAAKAVVTSLGGTLAVGGITSLPFYATIAWALRLADKEEDDPTEAILAFIKKTSGSALLRDVFGYGLPSAAGVSLGGSIGMELPVVRKLIPGESLTSQIANNVGDVLGIPWAIAERATGVIQSAKQGAFLQMLESASPIAVANALSSFRLAIYGQRSKTGAPINLPGKTGPRRLTVPETVAKFFGFQPVSSTKSYALSQVIQHRDWFRQAVQSQVASQIVNAMVRKDKMKVQELVLKVQEWNRQALLDERPELVLNIKDSIRSRRENRRPARKTRMAAMRYTESFF